MSDLSATLGVKDYTEQEVQRAATNLERLGKGDLNLDFTSPASNEYTKEVEVQVHIDASFKQVGASLNALITDTNKLSADAIKGQFGSRADVAKHPGEFGKVVGGINGTLDVVVDKLEWYRSILDAVPSRSTIIDMDMKWTFLNKAFEKLMVERGYVRDRNDAVGRPCSTANATICNTKNCGIQQLKVGVKESYFDWGNLKCKQDTANVLNTKGETVGYVETIVRPHGDDLGQGLYGKRSAPRRLEPRSHGQGRPSTSISSRGLRINTPRTSKPSLQDRW